MSATIINRNLRWRKTWVGEGPHGDTRRRLFATVFGVKHCCAAYRAEPKLELRPVVADPHVLAGGTGNLIGRGEAGQRRENAACPALTCEAVANANAEGFARNFNAQLPAGTRSGSRTHSAPRRTLFALWSTRIRPARPTGNLAPLRLLPQDFLAAGRLQRLKPASRIWPSVETRTEMVTLPPYRNPPIMQIPFV
jgi:hypothetical protein